MKKWMTKQSRKVTTWKRMTTMISFVTLILLALLGCPGRSTEKAESQLLKQAPETENITESQQQTQLETNTAPPIPNGINIGGVSIGITNFERKSDRILLDLVCRRISNDWIPSKLSFHVTDDRGNIYRSPTLSAFYSPGYPVDLVGFTWTWACGIYNIPEIAPIAKFELIWGNGDVPDELRGTIPEKFDVDYGNLAPFPVLDFEIKPEYVLTGKELEQSEDVSLWLGEPKVTEEIGQRGDIEKTISVSIPITIENRDYNPKTAEGRWQLQLQLNSGEILSDSGKIMLSSREVEAVSKQTVEYSFNANVEGNEHVQLIWVNRLPAGIPMPGVWAVAGEIDSSPRFWGFLPFSGVYNTAIYVYVDMNLRPDEWLVTQTNLQYSPDGGRTWNILLTIENIPPSSSCFWGGEYFLDYARIVDREHIIASIDSPCGATGSIETSDGGKIWYHDTERTQDGGKTWEETDTH